MSESTTSLERENAEQNGSTRPSGPSLVPRGQHDPGQIELSEKRQAESTGDPAAYASARPDDSALPSATPAGSIWTGGICHLFGMSSQAGVSDGGIGAPLRTKEFSDDASAPSPVHDTQSC